MKTKGEREREEFRLLFRGLTVEQLVLMSIWKHSSIKLEYRLFYTDTLYILCSMYVACIYEKYELIIRELIS